MNRNLALRCIAALSLIGAFAVAGFVVEYDGLQRFRSSQRIHDLTSRQRAEVQSIAFLTKALIASAPGSQRYETVHESMRVSLSNFERNLQELVDAFSDEHYQNSYTSRFLPAGSPDLMQLTSVMQRFANAANNVTMSEGLTLSNPDVRFIAENASNLLDHLLESIVNESQMDSSLRMSQALRLNLIVLIIILLSLVLVGVSIFRPMVRAVAEQHDRLLETNDFLEARARELSKSRESLRLKTQILRSILDTMGDAVIVVDDSGTILSQNRSADRLFGSIAEGSSLKQWHDQAGLRDKDDHESLIDLEHSPAAEALSGARINDIVYFVKPTAIHREAYVSATGRPMLDESTGAITGSVVSFRDVTERFKQAQALIIAKQEAESANRAKTEFLANISHEIRTPMSAILGYADCLLDADQSEEQRLKNIQIIRRNSRTLMGLIDDLLDLSKIEAGKLKVERSRVSLSILISEVYSLLSTRAQEKNIQLRVVFSSPIPEYVYTDATRLRQVLINILGNAIKFTDEGYVELALDLQKVSDTSHALFIQVNDTGCGIAKTHAQSLFSLFSQADNSATRRYGGSGLGLAISRRLARMLGGDLVLTDTELGKGSTFTITIDPGEIDESRLLDGFTIQHSFEPSSDISSSLRRDGLENINVLLVEDSPENRELFTYFLKTAGANVDEAEDGQIGLEMASRKDYDVMLLDIQLPGIDGYEVTRTLRDQGYNGVIVALTAHALTSEQQRCHESGFDGHIAKPVTSNDLITRVQHFASLKNSQAQRFSAVGGTEDFIMEVKESKPPISTKPVFDKSHLGEMSEPIRRVIGKFVERLPERITALEEACLKEDWNTVTQLAHQLKGTAASCGFPRLMEEADKIEESSKHISKSCYVREGIRNLDVLQTQARLAFEGLNNG